MKCFHYILSIILCLSLILSCFCVLAYEEELPTSNDSDGEQLIDLAVQRAYMVYFEEGKSPETLLIPEWVDAPYCELVSDARKGTIYYLWFQTCSSQIEQFEAFVEQVFTPEQGY